MADDGPGAPLQHHSRIFERLIRLDASRSKPGHGLGLGMVEAIALAHAGTAAAVEGPPGLAVEIRLPALNVQIPSPRDRPWEIETFTRNTVVGDARLRPGPINFLRMA